MSEMKNWDTWFADFPFEDCNQSKKRPVVILNADPLVVLSTKVTSHPKRENDVYDVDIIDWQSANLDKPSVVRISKGIWLDKSQFDFKIGELSQNDITRVSQSYIKFILQNINELIDDVSK